MIGVFITFRYGDNFNEQTVRKIAETARPKFEGMAGLRSKAFTLNSASVRRPTSTCGTQRMPPKHSLPKSFWSE